MTLIKELINILNTDSEPLQKRLKIADSAFTSSDVHLQSKETYLLNWITDITSNNLEAWELFNQWLNSAHFKNLDKSDLSQDCIRKIYEVVREKLNDNDLNTKTIVIDASLILINSPIFHNYFKSNLENYFSLLCTVVDSTSDKSTLLKTLKNENLFNKIYYTSDKFYKNFFKLLLPVLSEIDHKWNDSDIFLEICSLVRKYILRNNFKLCEDYLQQFYEEGPNSKHSIMKHFLTSFVNSYNNYTEICPKMLRIFLHSLCSEYPNNFLFIYKLSVILFQIIGFNLSSRFNLRISKKLFGHKSFDKSLTVAIIIFDLLSTYKTELSLKVEDTTFSEFIQILVVTIINLAKAPNKSSFQIIYYCIDINPLVVDSIITEVLQYLLLRKNDCKTEYIQLITVIFKVFVKLHRIQNLVSKMFPVLRQQLLNVETATAANVIDFDGDIPQQSVTYEYNIEDIFPPEVLSSFSNCVTHLASWQIMNLFKTFLYHLTSSTEDIQDIIHDKYKLIYIESIGIFLCQFLSSVRIAEHTVPDLAVSKFVKAMDELKDVLHKLGNILITMEHNHILMRTFLNICCKWGDLYMILSYYSTNVDMSLTEIRKQDHSLSNISYMHSYLTASQWSLISERVKNFGKTTCNELMQNLFIQHIKSVILFENTLNEEMVVTLISNFMLSMNDLWYFIIEDSFVLNNIVPKMQGSQIRTLAEMVVSNVPEPEGINKILPKLVNSEVMLKYLVYVILMKINKLMKIKKNSEPRLLSTKLFNEFHEIVCLQDHCYDIVDKLLVTFNEDHLRYEHCSDTVKINHEKLSEYLKLLTAIPIIYTSDCFRTCIGLYLATVLDDLRYFDKRDVDNGKCLEILLAGILQTTPKHVVSITPKNVIHYFVDNINNYKKIFTYFTQTLYVDNNVIEPIENISHFLIENISDNVKYLDCIGILLNGMIQHKKGKISPEHKNRITQSILKVSRELTNHVISKKIRSLTLYALILKVTLSQNEDIVQLKEHLDYYTEIALNTTTEDHNDEGIILLSTILHNKSTFEIVQDDFILKIWNKYKNAKVPKELREERGKLIALVFEHIDNENFKTLIQDLLRSTETSRYSKADNLFINYIDLWNCIIQSNFNQAKTNTWTQALLTLLQNFLITLHESDTLVYRKRIIEFEIHVIQTIRIQLTSSILDAILLTISKSISLDCVEIDNLCLKLLDVLLRYRKPLVTDILPSFLQRYRMLLLSLCKRSNSILDIRNIEELEKSAHCLEMLTKNLIMYGRHVARITPYIIADVLKQYENVSVIPEVKIHIDNCMYSLLELCDQHAISYLMRTLSTASTEIFKFVYENFNKYYRYKGKV